MATRVGRAKSSDKAKGSEMPIGKKEILGALPFLRRYARALTGSQGVGDQYVRIMLEMIVENPAVLPDQADVQRELFRLFHRVWDKTNPHTLFAERNDSAMDPALHELPPRQRQVLLLVALEGYAFPDVAYVLHIDEEQARALFNEVQQEIDRQGPAPIMIIEDEKIIALDIASIVEEMGHKVVGIAETEKDAFALAERARPALILADIQLKGGDNGIAAVRRILKEHDTPVIFITAYPEQLLTGEAPEPAFVIAKPFAPETVKAAISQALYVRKPAA